MAVKSRDDLRIFCASYRLRIRNHVLQAYDKDRLLQLVNMPHK